MPPNQINFENLHFDSFYKKFFSDAEDEVNTQNFECSYLYPNQIESFLSEKKTEKIFLKISEKKIEKKEKI